LSKASLFYIEACVIEGNGCAKALSANPKIDALAAQTVRVSNCLEDTG
jgi:hypothetical protein